MGNRFSHIGKGSGNLVHSPCAFPVAFLRAARCGVEGSILSGNAGLCPAFMIFAAFWRPHKERLASISMQGRHAKNTQGGQSFRERARTAAQQAGKKGSTVSFADTFRETRGNGRRRQRPDSKPRKPRKLNPVKKAVNNWCNRLLGVVSEGSFDQEEEFASHKTTRDYIWQHHRYGCMGHGVPYPYYRGNAVVRC